MDEDDILSELDNFEEITKEIKEKKEENKSYNRTSFNKDNKWPWEESSFKPNKINVDKFNKQGKYYTIAYSSASDIDDDITNKFTKVAKALLTKGYILRHRGSKEDKLWNELIHLEGMKYESFLPWKKFNDNIKKPKTFKVDINGHNIVAYYHKGYDKLKPGIKNIIGTEVQCCLSETYDNPCDLIIVYSPTGDELITKDSKFKELGNTTFVLKIAAEAGIPVFNLSKDDAITRIVEFLKAKQTDNN